MAAAYKFQDLTILSGQQISNSLDGTLGLGYIVEIPASLAGLTSITFNHASQLSGPYYPLTVVSDPSTPYLITLVASMAVPLDSINTQFTGFLQIVGNATTNANLTFRVGYKQAA